MTHEDAGHYSAKHPAGSPPDPAVAAALTERADGSGITCAAAFTVAEELQVVPSQVGRTADLLEYRITICQLGLFGYKPEKKIVKPADKVSTELRDRLETTASEGVIDCSSSWEIANALGLERMAISAVCERLGLKIVNCQLGAF